MSSGTWSLAVCVIDDLQISMMRCCAVAASSHTRERRPDRTNCCTFDKSAVHYSYDNDIHRNWDVSSTHCCDSLSDRYHPSRFCAVQFRRGGTPHRTMSFQLYLRPHPRTFYLISSTHALLFKQPDGQIHQTLHSSPDPNSAVVELLDLSEVDLAGLIKCNSGRFIGGVLGLLSLPIGEFDLIEATQILLRLNFNHTRHLLILRGCRNI